MIPFIHLGTVHIAGYEIPLRFGTYGLMVWLGLVVGYMALQADMRRRKLPGEPLNMILFIAIAGLAGSKLYHLLEAPKEFFAHPAQMFFSTFGFAWFGAVLGGLLAVFLFALYYKIPILTLLDASSPAAAIGYGIGRIGCLLSGDGDYGIPTSLPWGMSFNKGLVPSAPYCQAQGLPADCGMHPTPIYELLGAVVIFLWLWRQSKISAAGERSPGWVLGQYFVWTGLARFLVEFIRINPRVWLGLSNAQIASACSVILGIVLLVASRRPAPLQPLPVTSP